MTHSIILLRELLSRLTKKELVLLKKKIASNPDSEGVRTGRSKKLVNLLLSNPEFTSTKIEREIYGGPNHAAFSKLIERTIERIDKIFLNFNRDSVQFYSERNYTFFSLKRKLLILQIRFLRGIEFEISLQFEKIISLSKKYELYEILIEALIVKQRYAVLHKGQNAIDHIEKKIIKYDEIRKKIQRARGLWTNLAARINRSISSDDYKDDLARAVSILKSDFAETNSATICYFYFFLEVESHHIVRKYEEAEVFLKKALNLIMGNSSLYTLARHSDVLINLSNNNIFLGKFQLAKEQALKARELIDLRSENSDITFEVEFFARFYNGEIDNAAKIIEEIYHTTRLRNSPFLFSKRAYLFACIKTIQGDIRRSNELMLDVKAIEKDKSGWNIGRRVLTIINCIEAGEFESADLKVMNLEKYLKRITKMHNVRKRNIIIFRILLKLMNEGFDFQKTYKRRKKYFELLEGNDPDYKWNIKSPELIIFHEWFKGKIKQKSK